MPATAPVRRAIDETGSSFETMRVVGEHGADPHGRLAWDRRATTETTSGPADGRAGGTSRARRPVRPASRSTFLARHQRKRRRRRERARAASPRARATGREAECERRTRRPRAAVKRSEPARRHERCRAALGSPVLRLIVGVISVCLVVLVGAAVPSRALETTDALLAKLAGADPDLRTYRADVAFDVGLHSFPYLRKTLHGNAYFKRPARMELVFSDLPPIARGFRNLYVGLGTPERLGEQVHHHVGDRADRRPRRSATSCSRRASPTGACARSTSTSTRRSRCRSASSGATATAGSRCASASAGSTATTS